MFLASARTGILFTIAAIAAAVLVFCLVKLASSIKRGGSCDAVIKRIGLLDPHELRFNLEFENASKQDWVLDDICLSYYLSKEVKVVCKMTYKPLARGLDLNFVRKKDGNYGFLVEKGKKQSAVVDYLLPDSFSLPKGARYCLSYVDANGQAYYAFIDLKSEEASLLSFKRLRK